MKRLFDFIMATMLIILLIVPMLFIAIAIHLTSKGPIIYWSDRVGCGNLIFKMPKFRSMRVETPPVATHLMKDPISYLSPIGAFLRRSSLDELPQLFSIIKGDMSFVGPRPALFNQDDLIALRHEMEVDQLIPGVTGWAQINGRDNLSINEKVLLDAEYKENMSFWLDLKILWMTLLKVIKGQGISH